MFFRVLICRNKGQKICAGYREKFGGCKWNHPLKDDSPVTCTVTKFLKVICPTLKSEKSAKD